MQRSAKKCHNGHSRASKTPLQRKPRRNITTTPHIRTKNSNNNMSSRSAPHRAGFLSLNSVSKRLMSSRELDPNVAYSNSNVASDAAQRRWYRQVDIAPEQDGSWALLLNGGYARTNRNNKLIVPTKAYALACALEFENQTTFMIPHTMPLIEVAKIAIDRTEEERAELTENIMNIFNCDSATHRSDPEDSPALARAQAKVFDPMIDWLSKHLEIEIVTTDDFWGCDQSQETNQKVLDTINALDMYQFIALDNITALGKSAIVGFNFLYENINIDQTVRASLMEEYYQIKVSGHQVGDTYGSWLMDASARQRVGSHRAALLALQYSLGESSNWKMQHPSHAQSRPTSIGL